ncbi:MAG: hypothetical protein DHS20C16_33760 [Phycisphaerae bacterium]|nr:MAG: hypothetical protein DHS20C16_33760 [Phycisphaerae bacterium]
MPEAPTPGRLYFGTFGDERETIDEVILAPQHDRSGALAGVDISAHGGIRVVERVLMTLTRRGAMLVSSDDCSIDESFDSQGDWTAQIKNDAMRLLTRTTTRRAAMFLMKQADILPAAYTRMIDLSDLGKEAAARAELTSLIERSQPAKHLVTPPKISVLGPPNAGKSSLINRLAGRNHVVVSDTEGTTRDWVTVPAVIDGIEITMVDTAGLRETPDSLEETAILRGRSASASSNLQIWIFDRSANITGDMQAMMANIGEHDILVAHKSDLPAGNGVAAMLDQMPKVALAVSAATGDGLEDLRNGIVRGIGLGDFDDTLPVEFDADRLDRIEAEYRTMDNSDTSLAEIFRRMLVRS